MASLFSHILLQVEVGSTNQTRDGGEGCGMSASKIKCPVGTECIHG